MRKPIQPNKTKLVLLSLLALFLLVLVLYLAVLIPMMEADRQNSVTTTSKVPTVDGEGNGITAQTLLMYPRVERSDMASIEVFNNYNAATGRYDSYKFTKDVDDLDLDGDTNDFVIEGHPANTYNEEKFASLVVDTGYTACLGKLDELKFDGLDEAGITAIYSGFGLAVEQNPTYYRMTEKNGTVRTVYIGTKTVDGNYYARLEGREAVYVLYSSLKNSVLAPLAFFVDPGLTFEPESQYAYSYAENFAIFHDRTLVDMLFGDDTGTEEAPDFDASKLSPFVMFGFMPSTERDLFQANCVYSMIVPSNFYIANDIRVDAALKSLAGLQGTETLKLGLTKADFAEGGLLADVAYTVYFEMPYDITYDENEDPVVGYWVKNILFATKLGEDGTYTVGSLSYTDEDDGEDGPAIFLNMIAKVAYEDMSFLEADLFDWVQSEIFAVNINDVASLEFSSSRGDYFFTISGDGNPGQTVYEHFRGFKWYYQERDTEFRVNEQGYCDNLAQFRQLYMMLLTLDYEGTIAGDSGLSEAEIEAIMADDSNCLLTFTLTMEDSRSITYRFYPYSERHAMVSVSGDGMKGVSLFYTSSVAVRHIVNATYDLVSGVEIDADRRY